MTRASTPALPPAARRPMSTLPILDELPGGYFVEESPRGVLAVHADAARTLHECGYGPESDGALVPSELAGRAPLFELAGSDGGFLVRRFQHGGLLRWATGHRFLDAERPFRELVLSDSLRRVGVRTPLVVAARARSVGVGWSLDVMTRRVPGTTDLGWVLGSARRGEIPVARVRAILVALGELVRTLHRHGYVHADLQPNNVLVGRGALEGEAPELWLLDLDRSFFVPELSDAERRANLRRLYRHVARREEQHGRFLHRTDYARFFRGYETDRPRWKADWRAVAARHSRGLTLHRLGWLLERAFARRRHDGRADGGLLYPGPPRSRGES